MTLSGAFCCHCQCLTSIYNVTQGEPGEAVKGEKGDAGERGPAGQRVRFVTKPICRNHSKTCIDVRRLDRYNSVCCG